MARPTVVCQRNPCERMGGGSEKKSEKKKDDVVPIFG
jgi:hypothetical protein